MEKIVRTIIMPGQKPTEEQIKEIEEAAKRPVSPDEDCPELRPAQYAEMAEVARERRNKNHPQ